MRSIDSITDQIVTDAGVDRPTAATYVTGAVITLGYDAADGRSLVGDDEATAIVQMYAPIAAALAGDGEPAAVTANE